MEQKIIGYNLNELGKKHKKAINAIRWHVKQPSFTPCNGILFEPNTAMYHQMKSAGVLDIWFTPVYEQPKYKEGEWYYVEFNTHTAVVKIKDVKGEKFFYSCNINHDGIVWDDGFYVDDKGYKTQGIATEEQKLQHFSAAARKKGFVDGVRVKTLVEGFSDEKMIIMGDKYFMVNDELWVECSGNFNAKIFNGITLQWAEIVQPKEESIVIEHSFPAVIDEIIKIRKHLNL